jgi:hypothetical protein
MKPAERSPETQRDLCRKKKVAEMTLKNVTAVVKRKVLISATVDPDHFSVD